MIQPVYIYNAFRHYTSQFGKKIASLLPLLKPGLDHSERDTAVDAFRLWDEWGFDDLWRDAEAPELVQYLYGAYQLRVPPGWKERIPLQL